MSKSQLRKLQFRVCCVPPLVNNRAFVLYVITVASYIYRAYFMCPIDDEERVRRLKRESNELGIADSVVFKTNVCCTAYVALPKHFVHV